MFQLLKRNAPSSGSVFFRGNLAPRPEEFDFLTKLGIELRPIAVDAKVDLWALAAKHSKWGQAEIVCPKRVSAPDMLVRFARDLSDQERSALTTCSVGISVSVPSKTSSVLRDRKLLLRYLRAILADDGIAASDLDSTKFWSRSALDEELAHDAELDISSLYVVHSVTDGEVDAKEPNIIWMHTHGLGELGAFDFDILRPHRSWVDDDVLRSTAFCILDGHIKPDHPKWPMTASGPEVRFVPAAEFMAHAPKADRELRDDPHGDHLENRSVLCDVAHRGFFGFGGNKIRAASGFSVPMQDANMVVYPTAAGELMAERARATVHLAPELLEELQPFKPQMLAKLGYPTDSGRVEHLWFEVHRLDDETLEATLMNQPFDIKSMNQGDRDIRPLSRITDWLIGTPFGSISPRDFSLMRMVRDKRDMLLQMMAKLEK